MTMGITELVDLVRAGLDVDEWIAREACGGTVVGEPGNWQPAPGGDEWEVDEEEVELLVALRPGLPLPPEVMGGYWGVVVAHQEDDSDRDAWVPLPQFRHAARQDPARTLAEVAAKRRLVDQALAWEHVEHEDAWYSCPAVAAYAATRWESDACRCGRDERVLAILQALAAPYQET